MIPVPMFPEEQMSKPDNGIVNPGSGSEKLMPIFCSYQYSGMPSGKAMIKSKFDYFNHYRNIERDDFSLATILMFNLYGNPMLCLEKNEKVLESAVDNSIIPTGTADAEPKAINLKKTKRLVDFNRSTSVSEDSVLQLIQELVDNNLKEIHESISKSLYEHYGLEPRNISFIDEYSLQKSDGSTEDGFVYGFRDNNKVFSKITVVEIDRLGKVLRKFETK